MSPDFSFGYYKELKKQYREADFPQSQETFAEHSAKKTLCGAGFVRQ